MKLQARQIDSFLSDPGEGVLGALIFGADQGLVSERAQKLAKTIVDDVSDPFRVSTLTNDDFRADPARLTDELTSQSLTGGRRVVFLRVGGGDIAKQLGPILEDVPGDTLLIVEAGALTARSGLRKMFEKEANLVSIACYSDDGRAIAGLIDEVLGANGLTVQPDAKNFLLKQLGSDRLVSRRELEKLALFVGEKPSVSLEDTVQIIGDSGALSLEEVAFAVADGDGDK
ncbi:MAG: DNA polymerase III subunit delta, partial [Rhodospirillales bacterium]|nr:DNA polymerase III subunit delta [Rhodospirillales bacterium]